MTRLTLRTGFTLQAAPGGVGHITDTRTGDALVVPSEDYSVLAAAAEKGLDSSLPEVAGLLAYYGPFFVEVKNEAAATEPDAFYELNIEDAPTVQEIAQVAPVATDRATTLTNVPAADIALELAMAETAREEAARRKPVALDDALQTHPTQQVSPAEVKAMFEAAAVLLASPAPVEPPRRSSKRPLLLTLVGVTVLGLAVAATFALRPGGEPSPLLEVVVDAGAPDPIAIVPDSSRAESRDASTEELIDAGAAVAAVETIDAGPAVAALETIDAGAPAEAPDAGIEEDTRWLTAEVQARGRVKMGEVLAPTDGELAWTVTDQQRVKARQSLGTLGSQPLTTPSVGLAILKQPEGASVKRGAVVAEIIYFEAWARGLVRGAVPKNSWRCEVTSAATQQKADCKISVVAPKPGGALVTVAIEPRWFDGAADAVLRLAPP